VLCELNAIEQVVNIAQTTVMLDAWGRGQKVTLHGWCYGLKDGLINNLHMTVDSTEGLDALYRRPSQVWRHAPGLTHPSPRVTRRSAPTGEAMFPQRLDSPQAYGIAKAMMDGFNRHYRLFRTESAAPSTVLKPPTGTASSGRSASASSFMTCG
jgi:hypothetical protein